jgi:hypothetical protein
MEPDTITALVHNPIIAPYLRTEAEDEMVVDNNGPWKRLNCIYLDTTLVLADVDVPTKVSCSFFDLCGNP